MNEDEIKVSKGRIHTFYGLSIFFLILALILTNIFDLIGFNHTRQLNRYKENLTSLESPRNTYAIGAFSDIGHIDYSNGDNCDYIVGQLFETDLLREEIIKFYSGVSIPSVNGKHKTDVNVSFFEGKSLNGRLVYQIQAFEDSIESGFDIRCS
ncbi:MAG: hypothetical protein P0Y55_08650 [Candidatus Cohnella colombiensis]|uniref:Uncharacterized protein n=1 Tax=Candidatus Cohnella colombiensis TaxID=3121368 RepID=A0AA95F026_9BACL|nr:MAG: hypothetical protein P0Y55_08650 [Cohnella sp.]